MDRTELKIEYVPIDSLKAYKRNAKLHPAEQIDQIKKSIQDYGFRDPVATWKGEIVEGHGRILAAKELGLTEVPVIRLDDMTDEQRREYALVHNQTTMNSGFDLSMLDLEIDDLPDFDAVFYGIEINTEVFDESDLDDEREKTNVIVSINCGAIDNYEKIKDELQTICDSINGSLSVKMQ